MKRLVLSVVAVVCVAFAARPLRAQIPGAELTQVLASRPALESLLTQLTDASQSRDYSAAVREQARRDAARVRTRLTEGDFHVGDRISLQVEAETTLTGNFTVSSGRQLVLPNVGAIPLQGVLRYDLPDYLTSKLRQFIRDPKVRAQALIRIELSGGVNKQGFFTVPVAITVDSAYGIAGGFAATADLKKMRITRSGEVLWEGEAVHDLITTGITLDALGIQAGDVFSVDLQPTRNTNPVQRVQAIQYLLGIPISLFALAKLFGL